nr:hypothetical protein C5F59_38640 [Streptomyces sp. QL37]
MRGVGAVSDGPTSRLPSFLRCAAWSFFSGMPALMPCLRGLVWSVREEYACRLADLAPDGPTGRRISGLLIREVPVRWWRLTRFAAGGS